MKKLFTLLAALATTASLMAQDVTATWTLGPKAPNLTDADKTAVVSPETASLTGTLTAGSALTAKGARKCGTMVHTTWSSNTTAGYQEGEEVDFVLTPSAGSKFVPSQLSFSVSGIKASNLRYVVDIIADGVTTNLVAETTPGRSSDSAGAEADDIFNNSVAIANVASESAITIRFKLYASDAKSRELGLANIVVAGSLESLSDDREDAQIAWSVADVTVKNTDLNPELPTLNNPLTLGITYASSNEAVAAIDAEGNVTVNGLGTTTITATAPDAYKNNKASYTLSVVRGDVVFAWNAEGMTLGTVTAQGTTNNSGALITFANNWGNGNDNNVMLTVDGGFKAGDVIAIKGYIDNKDTTKRGAVNVSTDLNNVLYTTPDFANKNAAGTSGPLGLDEAATYTLCLKQDVDALYISRNGNTKTLVNYILVTRDPNAQNELKNIYLAGNINGWNTENIDYKFSTADYKTYTLNLPDGLKGEFKVVVDGEWYGSSNAKVGEVFNMHSPDNNAIAPTLGKTTFTLNVEDFTALVEGQEYTPVYFIGESTANEKGEWLANKVELNTNDGVNYSHNFAQGFAGAWRLYVSESVSFGKTLEKDFEYAAGKFTLPAVGVENFNINFNEGVTLNVALAARESVKEAPVATEISLVEDAAPVKVYFANTLGWETVKAHFFHESWGTAWPGNKMNLEGNSQPAEAVAYSLAPLADEVAAKTTYHSIEIPASATGVVINNDGAAQTVDIEPEHMMLYTPSGDTDSEGKYVVNKDTTTGVEDVEVENAAAEAVYYNLQGVRVDNPAAGNVYIRRQGAKTEKIRF